MSLPGSLDTADLDEFIATYKKLLADLSEEEATVPVVSFADMNSELSEQITSIEQMAAAYEAAGGEFDSFNQKQVAVKKTFEELIQAGADTEFLNGFIAQYREFLETGEKTASIAEILSSVDEAAFNLRNQYARMGIELSETESKTKILEEKLAALTETGEYTEWEFYQIEQALKALREETAETTSAWDSLSDSMTSAMSGLLEDAIGSLGSGDFDLAGTAQSAIDTVIGGAADAAMAAFPQFAPLIALGEGAIKGLNKAIFDTISATKEANDLIDEQHSVITDLFADVLDLEAELADQRREAITEQMELLATQHDLEMEILRDRWNVESSPAKTISPRQWLPIPLFRSQKIPMITSHSLSRGCRDQSLISRKNWKAYPAGRNSGPRPMRIWKLRSAVMKSCSLQSPRWMASLMQKLLTWLNRTGSPSPVLPGVLILSPQALCSWQWGITPGERSECRSPRSPAVTSTDRRVPAGRISISRSLGMYMG